MPLYFSSTPNAPNSFSRRLEPQRSCVLTASFVFQFKSRMNPTLISILAVLLLIPASSRANGYALNQPLVLYSVDSRGTNFQRGVNYRRFSSPGVTNTPVNFSDNNGIATVGQFRGIALFGGVVRPGSHPNGPEANVSALDTNRSYELNARSIGLQHGPPSGPVKYVLRTAQAGASTTAVIVAITSGLLFHRQILT